MNFIEKVIYLKGTCRLKVRFLNQAEMITFEIGLGNTIHNLESKTSQQWAQFHATHMQVL